MFAKKSGEALGEEHVEMRDPNGAYTETIVQEILSCSTQNDREKKRLFCMQG